MSEYLLKLLHRVNGFSPLDYAAQWMEIELEEEKSAIRRFGRIVYALFLRQLQTRLGGEVTGFIWVVLQPLVMILLFTVMHAVISGRSSSSYDVVVFMGSGMIPFFLFRTILQTSINVFKQNRSLYFYPQVKPIDAFLANALLESSIYGIVTLILLSLAMLVGVDVIPKDFDWVIVGILWLILLAMSWGLLLGVFNLFYPVVGRFVSFLTLPLLILSAVFFPVNILPPLAREWILYNPVVHFMELIHGSYLSSLDTRYVDYGYMIEWTIVPLFLGLWLYRRSEWKFVAQ